MHISDFSLVVGTTAITVPIPPSIWQRKPLYMRIWNVAPTNGGTIWICRAGTLIANGAVPAVVNGAGSFPLAPGLYELFQWPQSIPINPISVISTEAGTPLTIEIGFGTNFDPAATGQPAPQYPTPSYAS